MAKFDNKMKGILVKHGVIGEEDADEVMESAEKQGKSLCAVLLEKGYEEAAILAALSKELNLPPVDLARMRATREALDTLPEERANEFGVVPLGRIGNILTVAISNPYDILKLDDLQMLTRCEIRPVLSTDVGIEAAIQRFYRPGEDEISELVESTADIEMEDVVDEEEQDLDLARLMEGAQEAPVVKLVNLIIVRALQSKASDIHIEPFPKQIRVRYRQDGVLHETFSPPKRLLNAIVSRIKIMSSLDIAERSRPQDGKIQLRFEGRQIDFRVSILPVIHGEKVVLRILDSSNLSMTLDQMGWEPQTLEAFRKAIRSPWGMILVTGPTGSGKSTTLYSALREVMSVEDNLVTVEDPVEYQIEGINQVQINPKRGLTFASALRSILRQSPDIIMVGEIRDLETAEIAIQAALTGHLVMSTLHTNDAPSSVTRLVDMGIDPFMVASSVILVTAQRLCRRLCDQCKEPVEIPKKRLLALGFKEEECEGLTLYGAKGCPACAGGYKGRFAIVEPMVVTESIRRLILDGGSAMDIKRLAIEEGMITLRRCGILNAIRGKTSLEEVVRVTMAD